MLEEKKRNQRDSSQVLSTGVVQRLHKSCRGPGPSFLYARIHIINLVLLFCYYFTTFPFNSSIVALGLWVVVELTFAYTTTQLLKLESVSQFHHSEIPIVHVHGAVGIVVAAIVTNLTVSATH